MNYTPIAYNKQSGNGIKEAIFIFNSMEELPEMNSTKKGTADPDS